MRPSMRSILILTVLCASVSYYSVCGKATQCNCGTLKLHKSRSSNAIEVLSLENCTESSAEFMGTAYNGRCFVCITHTFCRNTEGQCASSSSYMTLEFNRIGSAEKELSPSKKASLEERLNDNFKMIVTCSSDFCFSNPMSIQDSDWEFESNLFYTDVTANKDYLNTYYPIANSNRPILQTTTPAIITTRKPTNTTRARNVEAGEAHQGSQASGASEDGGKGSEIYKILTYAFGVCCLIILALFAVYIAYTKKCFGKKSDAKKDKKKGKNKKKKAKMETETGEAGTTVESVRKTQVEDAPGNDGPSQDDLWTLTEKKQ